MKGGNMKHYRKMYVAYDTFNKELPYSYGTKEELKELFNLKSIGVLESMISRKQLVHRRYLVKPTLEMINSLDDTYMSILKEPGSPGEKRAVC